MCAGLPPPLLPSHEQACVGVCEAQDQAWLRSCIGSPSSPSEASRVTGCGCDCVHVQVPESIHRVPLAELEKTKAARRRALAEQTKAKYTEDQVRVQR